MDTYSIQQMDNYYGNRSTARYKFILATVLISKYGWDQTNFNAWRHPNDRPKQIMILKRKEEE